MLGDVDRVANVREAAHDLHRLGEAAENGREGEEIEQRANPIVVAQIGDEVAHGAHAADERNEGENNLSRRARYAQIASEIAKEGARHNIAEE